MEKKSSQGWLQFWSQALPYSNKDWASHMALFLRKSHRIFPLDSTSKFLDIGCGPSELAVQVGASLNSYCGVDGALPIVELAKKRTEHLTNVEVLFQDLTDTFDCLPEGPFNRILCLSVAQYFAHPGILKNLVLAASKRLSPGGLFLIADLPKKKEPILTNAFLNLNEALKNGFFLQQFLHLIRMVFGSYLKTRSELSLTYYSKKFLEQLCVELKSTNLEVSLIIKPLGLSPSRLSLLVCAAKFEGSPQLKNLHSKI